MSDTPYLCKACNGTGKSLTEVYGHSELTMPSHRGQPKMCQACYYESCTGIPADTLEDVIIKLRSGNYEVVKK